MSSSNNLLTSHYNRCNIDIKYRPKSDINEFGSLLVKRILSENTEYSISPSYRQNERGGVLGFKFSNVKNSFSFDQNLISFLFIDDFSPLISWEKTFLEQFKEFLNFVEIDFIEDISLNYIFRFEEPMEKIIVDFPKYSLELEKNPEFQILAGFSRFFFRDGIRVEMKLHKDYFGENEENLFDFLEYNGTTQNLKIREDDLYRTLLSIYQFEKEIFESTIDPSYLSSSKRVFI